MCVAMNFNINPFVRHVAKSSYFIRNNYVVARDCRILYIISGNGLFKSQNQAYKLFPKTFIYYPYNTPYQIISDTEVDMLFYTINFDFNFNFSDVETMVPSLVQNHNPENALQSIDTSLSEIYSEILYLPDTLWVEKYIESIYNETLKKAIGYEMVQSSYMRIILLNIYRSTVNNKSFNFLCSQIKELIHRNLALNNKSLAKLINYHPFYLNDVFKKYEGQTLHKYIVQQRVLKAYELITTTKIPLEEIAVMCGFNSQSHLSTVFKSIYSTSPSRLRMQI